MSMTGNHDMKPRDESATHAAHRCKCGDRALADCPGEWEQGCDLGNNPKYARVYHMTAVEQAALKRALFKALKKL